MMKQYVISGAERGNLIIEAGENGDVWVELDNGMGKETMVKFNYAQSLLLQSAFREINKDYEDSRVE